jgi:cellulose synthase/poly-beta-1,6-N-acetylglucosamine synthase-like glycosyltransferase
VLEIAAALAAAHFGVPLAYYAVARRWAAAPWDVRRDPAYAPRVAVIVPTYNEAGLIDRKLANIAEQDYPGEVEVIVADSASTDGTADRAEQWAGRLRLKVLREPERRGKAHALNEALRHADGDVVVVTDADSLWPRDALRKIAAWLADPSVGAVSAVKRPLGGRGTEAAYRGYYNVLRVGESKRWATPVFHGELAAFRKELLERIGGFPRDVGADDSHAAVKIAALGYRAIVVDDVEVYEYVPRQYWRWRVRRAQHLIQSFAASLRLKTPSRFKPVLYAEAYLHLVNPWLLPAAFAAAIAAGPPGWALAALGLALLAYTPYRTWTAMQIYLIAAAVRNLWDRQLIWEKEEKAAPR